MTAALYERVVDTVTMASWVTLLIGAVVFVAGEILGVFGRESR